MYLLSLTAMTIALHRCMRSYAANDAPTGTVLS
jgi:hypothetical protein